MYYFHPFHTANPLHGLSCYLNVGLCSASNMSVLLVQPAFHPCIPHCIPGTPEILISLYILSTKSFLLQLLGGYGGTDCSSSLRASWFSPLGEAALGVELVGETKGREEGKKQELFPVRS